MLTAIIRSCTGGEARTPDTRFWRPVLYQLSYSRVAAAKVMQTFKYASNRRTYFIKKVAYNICKS